MRAGAFRRMRAVILKDLADLSRNPAAILPALAICAGALVPAFLLAIVVPMATGESLAESPEFQRGAAVAVRVIPELQPLSGGALIQAFVLHQFAMLLLLVPVVGAMAIASHAVVGEKIARTLEPLLATPVSTAELLGAKAATPFAFAMLLTWSTLAIYVSGALLVGEPGVGESFLGARTALLFFLIGPLLALVSLMTAVVISSRVNDPRTAQQFGALVVLPITGLFVSQLVGGFVLGPAPLMLMACALVVLNALLLWVGVRVFDRERILMRWR